MKKNEVEAGRTYAAKISGEVVPVRIEKEHPRLKGWLATNEKTDEEVHIVSAQKLRGVWDEGATSSPEAGETTGGEPTPEDDTEDGTTDRTVAHESPMSGVDAAAKVLEEADEPLRVKEIYRRAEEAGYWRSDAKTPDRTLYSAILREMDKEGDDARFEKAGRGLFTVKD
ncbi:MAG: winged helix-turn-helix domain-containing protein [Planctomycetota bacterium]